MMTNTERIRILEGNVSRLVTQVDVLEDWRPTSEQDQKDLSREIADVATRLAVLESQIADVRKSQESWNGRFWLLFSILVAGLVTLAGNLIVLIAKIYSDA